MWALRVHGSESAELGLGTSQAEGKRTEDFCNWDRSLGMLRLMMVAPGGSRVNIWTIIGHTWDPLPHSSVSTNHQQVGEQGFQ